jgi:hypothetical protein
LVNNGPKPDLVSSDLIDSSHFQGICPKCGQGPYYVEEKDGCFRKVEVLEGPYFRYEKRESENYFDLAMKFFRCSNCRHDVVIFDFQVVLESLCSKLPPDYARKFSMKNYNLYCSHPEKMKTIIAILYGDFENNDFLDLNDNRVSYGNI